MSHLVIGQQRTRGPVGAVLRGKISVLSDLGIAYVLERETGERFPIARELDQRRFDKLKIGQTIAFRVNDFHAVAELID